MHAKTINLIV